MSRWPSAFAPAATCAVLIAMVCGSCESTAPPAGLPAPINACPDHGCAGYASAAGAPTCVAGACVLPEATSSLVMIISLPQDSGFASGRTFALQYDTLAASPASLASSNSCGDAGACDALPQVATPSGQYVVKPSVAQPFPLGVGWNLGNAPANTGLPVQVTYRLQWPISATATVDAESLGLPVEPVQAVTSYNQFLSNPPPGGVSSGGIFYETYLPSGVYERIMAPTAPFNQAFPPAIEVASVVPGTGLELSSLNLDLTQWTGQMQTIPAFDITIPPGAPEGWTAYLRDNSGLTISNVVALQVTDSPPQQVVLATAHAAPGVDALQNAVLVIAPPAASPIPKGLFAPIGMELPAAETYPQLPAPVSVTGTVTTTGGAAAPAQIVFEALAISVTSPQGTIVSNTSNFEFTGYASAALDASGVASYSVVLPQGTYRASVRPATTASEVTIVDPLVIDSSTGVPGGGPSFTVDVQRSALGTVAVADGRPLAGAIIDLLPVGCVDGTSTWCLPRAVQVPTANDGSFQLAIDPGSYLLRAKPADGSRLPWVVQSFSVAAGSLPMTIPPIRVPAPMSVGLSLYDPMGNHLIHAVVRAFSLTDQGSAVELGDAITDINGHYDMYLALPSQ